MRKNICDFAKDISLIPENKDNTSIYKKTLEVGQLGSIWLYLFKKYKVVDFFTINDDKKVKKLTDFYFGYDNIEEFPRWDYELTQTYEHKNKNVTKADFFKLFWECLEKKAETPYNISWVKWLIIHSHYMWFKGVLKEDIINYLHNNKENIEFDIVIFSCLINSKNEAFILIYNKKGNIGYTIIIKDNTKDDDDDIVDIEILEDTKIDFTTWKNENRGL